MEQVDSRMPVKWRALVVLVAVGLLALDRYSFGSVGGEGPAASHWWQVVAAVVMCVLLGLGAWWLLQHRPERARMVFALELFIFVLVNLGYLWRDGEGRLYWGYEHARTGLVVLVGGLVARLILNWPGMKRRAAQSAA